MSLCGSGTSVEQFEARRCALSDACARVASVALVDRAFLARILGTSPRERCPIWAVEGPKPPLSPRAGLSHRVTGVAIVCKGRRRWPVCARAMIESNNELRAQPANESLVAIFESTCIDVATDGDAGVWRSKRWCSMCCQGVKFGGAVAGPSSMGAMADAGLEIETEGRRSPARWGRRGACRSDRSLSDARGWAVRCGAAQGFCRPRDCCAASSLRSIFSTSARGSIDSAHVVAPRAPRCLRSPAHWTEHRRSSPYARNPRSRLARGARG